MKKHIEKYRQDRLARYLIKQGDKSKLKDVEPKTTRKTANKKGGE